MYIKNLPRYYINEIYKTALPGWDGQIVLAKNKEAVIQYH